MGARDWLDQVEMSMEMAGVCVSRGLSGSATQHQLFLHFSQKEPIHSVHAAELKQQKKPGKDQQTVEVPAGRCTSLYCLQQTNEQCVQAGTAGGDSSTLTLWTFVFQSLNTEQRQVDGCTTFSAREQMEGRWYWCCWTGLIRCPCAWDWAEQTYGGGVFQIHSSWKLCEHMWHQCCGTELTKVCLRAWIHIKAATLFVSLSLADLY